MPELPKAERGLVFVATQERWAKEAAEAAARVRRRYPELPIVLFSDVELTDSPFSSVVLFRGMPAGVSELRWHRDFGQKLFALARTPFRQTLYLDSDVVLLGKIDELFDRLEHEDLLLAHQAVDSKLLSAPEAEKTPWLLRNRPPCESLEFSPQFYFNAGVIAFRRSEPMNEFFRLWWQRWCEAPGRAMDQDSLNELLSEGVDQAVGLTRGVLDNKRYNVRPVMIPFLTEKEKQEILILHSRVAALNEQVFSALRART